MYLYSRRQDRDGAGDTSEMPSDIIPGAVLTLGGFLVSVQCFGTNEIVHKDTLWAEQWMSRVAGGQIRENTGRSDGGHPAGRAWGDIYHISGDYFTYAA